MKNIQNKSEQREKEVIQQKGNQLQEKSYTNREYKDRLFKFIFKHHFTTLSMITK